MHGDRVCRESAAAPPCSYGHYEEVGCEHDFVVGILGYVQVLGESIHFCGTGYHAECNEGPTTSNQPGQRESAESINPKEISPTFLGEFVQACDASS